DGLHAARGPGDRVRRIASDQGRLATSGKRRERAGRWRKRSAQRRARAASAQGSQAPRYRERAANLAGQSGVAEQLSAELELRVPKDLKLRGIESEPRILRGNPAWLSIWQHAARARADLICMATHSRDTGQGFVLGSQTKALLQHAQIPVLLVPQD